MKRKTKVIIASYALAALTVLSSAVYLNWRSLQDYRLAAAFSSGRALAETEGAVRSLSGALEKSLYATDSAMSAKICAQIYASSLAAETALSALPFENYELEQISAFLNMCGDYACSLNFSAADRGFTREETENLARMSLTAAEFWDCLREASAGIGEGSLIMDSRERRLRNIFSDSEPMKLSGRLRQYEEEFRPMEGLSYNGKYGAPEEERAAGSLSGEQMLELAGEYAGREPSELCLQCSYEGSGGRCLYSAGDMQVCVSPAGVDSLSSSRLVEEINISEAQAQQAAENYLSQRGYDSLQLCSQQLRGAVADFRFCKTQDSALFLDNYLTVSIALDDGSVYSFNAAAYDSGPSELSWSCSEESAAQALPDSLRAAGSRKVVRKSPGGREMACWEFSCVNSEGRGVKIYVDGESGRQFEILPEPRLGENSPPA